MYKTVAQSVLLCIRESWVVMGGVLKVLEGFHLRVVWRITGMAAKRGAGGEWEYSTVVEAMESVGLHPIGVYIKSRQVTIAERVA